MLGVIGNCGMALSATFADVIRRVVVAVFSR
ncbi:DUF1515 family protein [Rhizobium grahamii]